MIRKFVSQTVFFSFLVMLISSFVLYVIPGAGDDPWTVLSLHRGQWLDIHITCGFLFLAFGLWHAALNWRGLLSGIKRASGGILKSFWVLLAALALNIFVVAGAIDHIQPVKLVLAVYKENKRQVKKAYVGDPPREINLKQLEDLSRNDGFKHFEARFSRSSNLR